MNQETRVHFLLCRLEIKSSGVKLGCRYSQFAIVYLHQLRNWLIMLFKYDDSPENFVINESPSCGTKTHF